MLTVADRVTGGGGGKICQNLADVICERSPNIGVAVPRAPGVLNPSKVWSWALVCWSTAISKSSFTKNQGEPP